jgi:hypothetical protein
LTTKDLLDSPAALRKLSDMQIPVRTALKLRKVLKAAQAEIETITDQFKALGKKHAKRVLDEDGKPKVDDDGDEVLAFAVVKKGENGEPDVVNDKAYELGENKKAYDKDVEELLESELELDFEPIKADDLADRPDPKRPLQTPELKIETSLLYELHWLIAD